MTTTPTVTTHWCVEVKRGDLWEPNAARWADKGDARKSLHLWRCRWPNLPVRLVRVETTTVHTVEDA